MSKKQMKDPQTYARERLWSMFNQHAGLFTQMITTHTPERVRLSLAANPDINLEGWLGDFDDDMLSLYRVTDGAWILMSEWHECGDPTYPNTVGRIAVTGEDSGGVAKAVAMIESQGKTTDEWTAQFVAGRKA